MIFSVDECKKILAALDAGTLYFSEQKFTIGERLQTLTEINGRSVEGQALSQRVRQAWGKLNLSNDLPVLLTEANLRQALGDQLHDGAQSSRRMIPKSAYKA